MHCQNSYLGNYTQWEQDQVAQIAQLSDQQVFKKLHAIMTGNAYSWHTISNHLKAKHTFRTLRLDHFEAGNILYEWNVLCDERLYWKQHGFPSFRSFAFNRACLCYLIIIPTQVLGNKGKKLVESNVDTVFDVRGQLFINDAPFTGPEEEFRGTDGYCYAEGPEFRSEYIHHRVEI